MFRTQHFLKYSYSCPTKHYDFLSYKLIISTGYLEVVHDAFLSEGGVECISVIRQGIQDTIVAMQTEAGRQTLEESYR